MVECSLSMREAVGSIPTFSKLLFTMAMPRCNCNAIVMLRSKWTFSSAACRGISSDGRALALHARGGGTDARILQTRKIYAPIWFLFSVESIQDAGSLCK